MEKGIRLGKELNIQEYWKGKFPKNLSPVYEDKSILKDAKNMIDMCNQGHITSTDIADWLVTELKLPFRDAHKITGNIVALADKKKNNRFRCS